MPDTSNDRDLTTDITAVTDKPTSVAAWGAVLVGVGAFVETYAGGSWTQWVTGALPVALSAATAIMAMVRTKKK